MKKIIPFVLLLAGCSTTPKQIDRAFDIAENVASNLNAGAVGGTPPVVVCNNPQTLPAPPSAEPLPLTSPQTGSLGSSSSLDAIDISKARTISKYVKNIPAMPIKGELRNVKLSADRVTFETYGEDWIAKEWGRIAIIFEHTGELIAGEFDARKPAQRMKGLENIHGGYIQNKIPAQGSKVYLVVYDMKGTHRSNVAFAGEWK